MERVAIIGENSVEYVREILQIWNLGNCAVLIDFRIPIYTARKMMQEANVHKCYLQKSLLVDREQLAGFEIIEFEANTSELRCLPEAIYTQYRANQYWGEAVVLFSSGSTGKAKGVVLTHQAIDTNANAIVDYMNLKRADRLLIVKSLTHVSTLVGELLVCLKTHARVYIAPTRILPQNSLEILEQEKITTLCLNPSLLKLYTASQKHKHFPLLHLKAMYISGSIADPHVLIEAEKLFEYTRILNVYGLTEAGPRVTAQTVDGDNVIGSVGKPIANVRIRIINELGEEVAPGNIGIVLVHTPSLFTRYLVDCSDEPRVINGWLNTKDLGYIDDRKNLYIVGRSDNMTHIGSHNVYPESIESVIRSSGLIEDCVVVSTVNKTYGNILLCLYVSKSDTETELRDYCANRLATYEIPQQFISVAKITRTPNGKIDYSAMRERGYQNAGTKASSKHSHSGL